MEERAKESASNKNRSLLETLALVATCSSVIPAASTAQVWVLLLWAAGASALIAALTRRRVLAGCAALVFAAASTVVGTTNGFSSSPPATHGDVATIAGRLRDLNMNLQQLRVHSADTAEVVQTVDRARSDVLGLLNIDRERHHLPHLTPGYGISVAAQQWAKASAKSDTIAKFDEGWVNASFGSNWTGLYGIYGAFAPHDIAPVGTWNADEAIGKTLELNESKGDRDPISKIEERTYNIIGLGIAASPDGTVYVTGILVSCQGCFFS